MGERGEEGKEEGGGEGPAEGWRWGEKEKSPVEPSPFPVGARLCC